MQSHHCFRRKLVLPYLLVDHGLDRVVEEDALYEGKQAFSPDPFFSQLIYLEATVANQLQVVLDFLRYEEVDDLRDCVVFPLREVIDRKCF